MKRITCQCIILAAVLVATALALHAESVYSPTSVEITNSYVAGSVKGEGTWVLGAVIPGYTDPDYTPIFIETFDDYVAGPIASQGSWVRNSSPWGAENSSTVSSGRDKYLSGNITKRGGTAASCFFPDIFTNGNAAGRIELDFRRGILELDILIGPATVVDGEASIVINESVGGQFSCYNGGCFTPKYHGGYNNPQIIYRLWQPGTTYHLIMDLVRTGNVVTVATTVDGVPLNNLSGIVFTNEAPQGINSLMIRGADYITPECAIDNIKVSIPAKKGGSSMRLRL